MKTLKNVQNFLNAKSVQNLNVKSVQIKYFFVHLAKSFTMLKLKPEKGGLNIYLVGQVACMRNHKIGIKAQF